MSVTVPISVINEFISLIEEKISSLQSFSLESAAPIVQALHEIKEKASEIASQEPRAEPENIVEEYHENSEANSSVHTEDNDDGRTRKVKRRRTRVQRKISKVSLS